MKKFITTISIATSLFLSSANASGIPTVDVAAIAQQVIGYTQTLKDYAEQIKQYEQMVKDTLNFEKQMKELGVDMGSINEIFGEINGLVGSMKRIYSDINNIPNDILGSVARMQKACNFLESQSSFFGTEIKRIANSYANKTNRCISALSNGIELDKTIDELYRQIDKTTNYAEMKALRTQIDNIQKAREFIKQEEAKEQYAKMMNFYDTYHDENAQNSFYTKVQMQKDLNDFAKQLNKANNQKQAQALTNALLLKMLESMTRQYELSLEYSKASIQLGQNSSNDLLTSRNVSEGDFQKEYKEIELDEALIDLGYRDKKFNLDEFGIPKVGVQ
ncbi:hypothetical protein KDE13_09370 [Campylobacter sp. faydin G-140]|uniref:hypothetical protein n=1 Tax=Campylobacter anatolicus TaxID=2829105 RepID=UPI001B934B91|nr:hypothetical protein [Campylobacter anatolicus]MBR8466543.1 hypothetical protein [Campylobacter anatolicus]